MTPQSPRVSPPICDVFCRVVDNYGDIGVTWRLARQLAAEHGLTVRLIVDDLASFRRLVPAVDPGLAGQLVDGVSVVAWHDPLPFPVCREAADLVIEAFGCDMPAAYLEQMALRGSPPVWINLEYLSAEAWVAEHHLLPSPHPTLPLIKFFFFPGFTAGTGGLIREKALIARRDLAAAPNAGDELRVLVFAYEHAPLEALFAAMAQTPRPVACRISEGVLSEKLEDWRALQATNAPKTAPMLELGVQPFCPQAEFDQLLWQNDVLFVRGEDSFVRAQWAAKPFVWHIYPQSGDTHLAKLDAFLDLYCDGLPVAAAIAVRELWRAWNVPSAGALGPAWAAYVAQLPALSLHARSWSQRLSDMPDLAASLLSFYRKNAKIQGFAEL